MTSPGSLEALAAELAEQLPYSDIKRLAHACREGRSGLRALEAQVAGIAVRGACRRLRAHLSGEEDGRFAAGLLLGAAQARQRYQDAHHTDVVWTGPASAVHTSRLTSAVVNELIDSARSELLLVSYATFPPASLTASLAAAADRGVQVTLLLERSADNPDFHGGTAFPAVAARRWSWPSQKREPSAALHAKIIIVDRRVALVGSANLTGYAFEKNLECGILLHDRARAHSIAAHLESLLDAGILTPLA